jgi:hypothetical protein
MTYKAMLAVPVVVAILTMIGATTITTHVRATVDCSQTNSLSQDQQQQCQQAASNSDPNALRHHGALTGPCLVGVYLGSLISPPENTPNPEAANQAAAFCQILP